MHIFAYNNPVEPAFESGNRWELYRLLGDPSRLKLLALATQEELAIGELAELLGDGQPSVSRQVSTLRKAGLLAVRKQGTRVFVRLARDAGIDPVVRDALSAGRAACDAEGILDRVSEVLRARDRATREFFSKPANDSGQELAPSELPAYLMAVAALLPHRTLAVDVGTGEGRLLDVLAPLFTRVIGVEREQAQLARARARVRERGYTNVELIEGDAAERTQALAGVGADVVFASRVLHHAPRPVDMVRAMARLCRIGGALVVIDYAPHDDESFRERQADQWLGFSERELMGFARAAHLSDSHVSAIPPGFYRGSPDGHLPWQLMVARRVVDAVKT